MVQRRKSIKQRTEAKRSCGSLWEVTTSLTAVCSEEDMKTLNDDDEKDTAEGEQFHLKIDPRDAAIWTFSDDTNADI